MTRISSEGTAEMAAIVHTLQFSFITILEYKSIGDTKRVKIQKYRLYDSSNIKYTVNIKDILTPKTQRTSKTF